MRGYPQWRGRLDEAFVKLSGKLCYVRRALDHEGQVFASKRDKAVAWSCSSGSFRNTVGRGASSLTGFGSIRRR